ncbi:MAG: helix-turn-helix domain-containing protein, partial [bacterium]
YIHYNPVDAGIVSKESDYPFSSAGFYEGKKSYIEQLKRIDYDRSITDREFETYKGVIGTKEEYNKLLKRKPGREKSKKKERRTKTLKQIVDSLLNANGLDRKVFHKHRSKSEKQKLSKIIITLLKQGYNQSDIAKEIGFHPTTIGRMIQKG